MIAKSISIGNWTGFDFDRLIQQFSLISYLTLTLKDMEGKWKILDMFVAVLFGCSHTM